MLYWIGHFLFSLFYSLWLRVQVQGADNLPERGGVIVASNHLSYLDPPLLGAFLSRQIHFMAKKELFRPPLGPLIRAVGTFPVNREKADRQAIKTAIEILSQGGVLGIFPEGTRSKSGEMQEGALGMAFLAAKAQAQVLPAGIRIISGRSKSGVFIPRMRKISLTFGSPLPPPSEKASKEELQAYTARVMEEIEKLLQ